MAKKEKSGKDSATVAAKAAEKVGRDILKENPELKGVYVTTDGTAFAERNDAQKHAKTLKNREIFNIRREPEAGKEELPSGAEEETGDNGRDTETAVNPEDNAEADD